MFTPKRCVDLVIRMRIIPHGLIVLGWFFASAVDQGIRDCSERVGRIFMSFTVSAFLSIPLMAIFIVTLLWIVFERIHRFIAML